MTTVRVLGANVIDHLQEASGKLWREGFRDHSMRLGADVKFVAHLIDVAEAAEQGHARSQCGSCDAGLPMNCTCNPMDTALARLKDGA